MPDTELEKELQEIEVTIEGLQVYVDRAAVLERLMANKDFQQIIDQEYFVNECSRMLLLRDDPNLPPEKKKFLEADMFGPGALKRYFHGIFQMGQMASAQIAEARETMDEIHDEIAEGGDE